MGALAEVAWLFGNCADHHQTICGGFSTPDLSRTPIQLTHRRVRLVTREALERLALGIEVENGVGAEIAHPHLALFTRINGVSMRLIALQHAVAQRVEAGDVSATALTRQIGLYVVQDQKLLFRLSLSLRPSRRSTQIAKASSASISVSNASSHSRS